MHDPQTVAHEIKYPWRKKSELFPEGYRSAFLTIWHVDPETDGTDDSCGWFKRARHCDQKMLGRIARTFETDWDSEHGGWFHANGEPRLSVIAITLNMFSMAAWEHFKYDQRKHRRFMQRHLFSILHFAENPIDSLHDAITGKYGFPKREDRIQTFANIVYPWIVRAEVRWWQHPRWHWWHWKLQCHPLQNFKRWAFSRCCKCGKRFNWRQCSNVVTDQWNSTGPRWFRGEVSIYHGDGSCGVGLSDSAKPLPDHA